MERLLCLAIGYLFGIFQTGYIYGRVHGIDIRKYGSGNSGSAIATANQFIGDNQRNTGHDNYCHTQQDPQQTSLGNHSQINGIAQREGKEWNQRLHRFAEKFSQFRVKVPQGKAHQER